MSYPVIPVEQGRQYLTKFLDQLFYQSDIEMITTLIIDFVTQGLDDPERIFRISRGSYRAEVSAADGRRRVTLRCFTGRSAVIAAVDQHHLMMANE